MSKAKALLAGAAMAALLVTGLAGGPGRAEAQPLTKVTMAVPSIALYLAFAFVAEDQGYWKDAGIEVDTPVVTGAEVEQALVSGDVDVAIGSGPLVLATVDRNQKAITIAQLFDELDYQLILGKAQARKTGLDVKSSTLAQRAKALKGMTIAIGGVGALTDDFLTHILGQGGLDPQKDVTRSVIPLSNAVNVALHAGRVDAFVGSNPFTTKAVQDGDGVDWIDGARHDLPEMDPFVFSVIQANPAYCEKNAKTCRGLLAGVDKAVDFMKQHHDQAMAIVAKKLPGLDPAQFKEAFDEQLSLMPPGLKMNDKAWRNVQDFDLQAGLINAGMKRDKFDGTIYTNAYLQ